MLKPMVEVKNSPAFTSCLCCSKENKPVGSIKDIAITYYGGKNGVVLSLCSSCAKKISEGLNHTINDAVKVQNKQEV